MWTELRVKLTLRGVIACAIKTALCASVITCGFPTPSFAAQRPDILLSVGSQGPELDDVVMIYGVPTSMEQVEQDVTAVGRLTGWSIRNLRINNQLDGATGANTLYSAEFVTAGAFNHASGRLPIAPIVKALSHYRQLLVIFDINGSFQYAGNRDYTDSDVSIHMVPQVPGSYTYAFQVTVRNPDMGNLESAEGLGATSSHGRIPVSRLLIALMVAVLVGWGVYLAVMRLMLRTDGASSSP